MKLPGIPIWTLVLLGFLPNPSSYAVDELPTEPAQEASLLRAVGPDFKLKETPHFLVVHDSDPAIVNGFVSRIEQTYSAIYRFCAMNKIEVRRPPRRLEVIFYNTRREFEVYAQGIHFPVEGVYGVYFEPTNRSAFFNVATDPQLLKIHADLSAAQASLRRLSELLKTMRTPTDRVVIEYTDGRKRTFTRPQAQQELDNSRRQLTNLDGQRVAYADRINRTVVQHEATHQVLYNAGVHVRGAENPKWIVEGLACLFETPPDASGSGIYAINQLRLHDFREKAAGSPSKELRVTAQDVAEAIRAGRFIEPRRLVAESDVFDERGDRGAANYAMAWALVHYLQRQQPAQLAAYLKDLSGRPPGMVSKPAEELALFEKHFGPLDSSFINRWAGYILKLPVRSVLPGK